MSRTFKVRPKQTIRRNDAVLTPDMSVIVTTRQHTTTPFYNGAAEVQETYLRLFGFDYKKACCNVNDFLFEKDV